MARYVYIKRINEFQHYKDRKPPWVKLHRDFWTDRTLSRLDPAVRLLALGLVTVASEDFGRVERDISWLSKRLHLEPKEIETGINILLKKGFLASRPLAERKQAASPRARPTEQEAEKEVQEQELDLGLDVRLGKTDAVETLGEMSYALERLMVVVPTLDRTVLDREAKGLSPAQIEKVRESAVKAFSSNGRVKDPAAYVIGALRSERQEVAA